MTDLLWNCIFGGLACPYEVVVKFQMLIKEASIALWMRECHIQ